MVICTLGDLLLDVVVKLSRPIADGDDTNGETRVGAGGQAANVPPWAAALGERACFGGGGTSSARRRQAGMGSSSRSSTWTGAGRWCLTAELRRIWLRTSCSPNGSKAAPGCISPAI